MLPEDRASTGAHVQAAFSALMRWATRSGVRARLWGAGAAGLSPTDVWLAEAIAAHGPVRAAALAQWQGVDKSTITLQVRRLERAGLVARAADPDDGRAALLSLSDHGRAVLAQVRSSGARLLDERLADWSEADRATFARLLTRFVQGLDADPGT